MKLITSHHVRYCDSGILVIIFNCIDKNVWAHAYNNGYYLFNIETYNVNDIVQVIEQEIKIPELENLTGYIRSDFHDKDQITYLLTPFKLLK